MINIYLILLLLIYLDCMKASLSSTEEKVATDLMKELQIYQRILVKESDSDLAESLHSFKNSDSWSMIVSYKNLEELLNFLIEGSFPCPPTMIVLKIPKLSRIAEFLNELAWVRCTQ